VHRMRLSQSRGSKAPPVPCCAPLLMQPVVGVSPRLIGTPPELRSGQLSVGKSGYPSRFRPLMCDRVRWGLSGPHAGGHLGLAARAGLWSGEQSRTVFAACDEQMNELGPMSGRKDGGHRLFVLTALAWDISPLLSATIPWLKRLP